MTTKKSSKDKMPEIEPIFYNKTQYEITINPSNTNQFVFDKRGDLDRLQKMFIKINPLLYEYIKPYGDYHLQWEISEPQEINGNKGSGNISEGFPRVHYHGTLNLTDPIGFLMNGMANIANSIGNIQINQIYPQDGKKYDREKYWKQYICKQKSLMKPYCEKYGVPYIITHDTSTKLIKTNHNPIDKYIYRDTSDTEE